jgi:hypothetical protein
MESIIASELLVTRDRYGRSQDSERKVERNQMNVVYREVNLKRCSVQGLVK